MHYAWHWLLLQIAEMSDGRMQLAGKGLGSRSRFLRVVMALLVRMLERVARKGCRAQNLADLGFYTLSFFYYKLALCTRAFTCMFHLKLLLCLWGLHSGLVRPAEKSSANTMACGCMFNASKSYTGFELHSLICSQRDTNTFE